MEPLYPSPSTFNPRPMDTHPNVVCYDYDHGNQWAAFRCTCAGCTWFMTKVDTTGKEPKEVREIVCTDHDGFATGG